MKDRLKKFYNDNQVTIETLGIMVGAFASMVLIAVVGQERIAEGTVQNSEFYVDEDGRHATLVFKNGRVRTATQIVD